MQLEITRTTEGPLPLVTSIPNFGVAQLEGYNGVGKTLTVRLLELCSGTRPRLPREVWRSFCAGLGQLRVTATELVGANELAWEIDGGVLLEASEAAGHDAPPNDAWFASITHDGRQASIEDIRRLFAVERIAGDRGLIEMLADEADSAAGELTAVSEIITNSETLAVLESNFAELKGLLTGFSSAAIREHREEAERARQERDAAKNVLADAVRQHESLLEIAEIRARVSAISEEAEVLSAKVAAIDQEINETRAARDVAARGLADAETEAGQSNEVRNAVAKADRQYQRATTDRERLTSELAQLEGIVGLPSGSDAAALDRRVGEIHERLAMLERRRNEIDAAPGVVKLVDGVRPALTGAITAGLGDVELLRRPDDPLNVWTVSDVSDALARRRDEADAVPSPREAVAIDEEISRLRSAVEAAGAIRDKRRLLERAVERQDAAQRLATELSARLDSAIAENLEHLRITRRQLDDKLYELTASRTILEYRRDTIGSPEERDALRARLARQLETAGLAAEDLDTALTESTPWGANTRSGEARRLLSRR